jgi:hypothetical protein
MRIKVNGRTVEIFSGARVKDVLRKYSAEEWARVRRKEKTVTDSRGREVGLEGELSGGEELLTRARGPEEPRP